MRKVYVLFGFRDDKAFFVGHRRFKTLADAKEYFFGKGKRDPRYWYKIFCAEDDSSWVVVYKEPCEGGWFLE